MLVLGEAGTRHWDSEDSASWTPLAPGPGGEAGTSWTPPPVTSSSLSSSWSWSPAWLLVAAVADLVMRLVVVLVLVLVSPPPGLNTDLENSRRLLFCFTLMLSPAGG